MSMKEKFDTNKNNLKNYVLFCALALFSFFQFLFHYELYCHAAQRFFSLWQDVINLTISILASR